MNVLMFHDCNGFCLYIANWGFFFIHLGTCLLGRQKEGKKEIGNTWQAGSLYSNKQHYNSNITARVHDKNQQDDASATTSKQFKYVQYK